MHQSSITVWPPALTHQGIVSTRPLVVWCGIWPQDVSGRSVRSCRLQGRASMDWICCPHAHCCLAVDRGQHGHSDWSAAMQPHTQQTAIHCVFWHLSIRACINFFNDLSYSSSSVESGHPSERASISLGCQWPCRRITSVPSLDHFW